MSRQPIDILLDSVEWQASQRTQPADDGMLYATHSGVLVIGELKLRCYRLSDGQAVFDADDFAQAFGLDIGPRP